MGQVHPMSADSEGEKKVEREVCPKCGSRRLAFDAPILVRRVWWKLWRKQWFDGADEWACCLDCDWEVVFHA
jgi:hypothetical protein